MVLVVSQTSWVTSSGTLRLFIGRMRYLCMVSPEGLGLFTCVPESSPPSLQTLTAFHPHWPLDVSTGHLVLFITEKGTQTFASVSFTLGYGICVGWWR